MRTVYASRSGGSLYLGKRGTNETARVLFPLEEGMDEIVVLHQRAGDEHPYAVPVRITDDGVEWIVSLADTAVAGAGAAEVIYKRGGAVAKSVTYGTRCDESIDDGEIIVPTAAESWVQYVAELTASAQLAERGAEAAAEVAVDCKDDAQDAAQRAAEQAARAERAADGIGEATDQAEQARDSAVQAAGEALEKANAAQESAGEAALQMSYARGYAAEAKEAKEAADVHAQTAASYSAAAAESAGSSQNFAENAQNSAESAQISAQSAQSAAEQARVDIEAETAARTIADAALQRSLDMLWRLNKGISYVFEQDTAEAYSKTVPSGAVVGDVQSVGGKSVVFAQLVETNFYSGANSEISVDSDGVVTVTAKTSGTGYKFGFRSDSRIYSDKNLLIVYDVLCSERYSWGYDVRNSNNNFLMENNAGEWTRISAVQKTFSQTGLYPYIFPRSNITEGFSYKVKNFQIFDLGSDENKDAFFAAFPADYYHYTPPTIISADVESVEIGGKSIPIPAAIRALPGYGWSAGTAFNEVDFERKVYVQRVQRVDMGGIGWQPHTGYVGIYFPTASAPVNNNTKANILSESVETISTNAAFAASNPDLSIWISAAGNLSIRNNSVTTVKEYKTWLNGKMLYYELAEPIETDISSLLDDSLENIEVEPGGTIEFRQGGDFRLPVPNREEYLISVAEVSR